MGGEGAQWIGLAPFTDDRHFVQNLGDGTFHHSGSLAIRAAVAAGVEHHLQAALQRRRRDDRRPGVPSAGWTSPTLTRWLALEGVARIVVTTDGARALPRRRARPDRRRCATATSCRRRRRELAAIAGVTVLIHDDAAPPRSAGCASAASCRRPPQRVLINERVCEGCGDCGEKSNCLSVLPVETEFGRKTRDPPGLVQQGLLVPEGRLPVVPGRSCPAKPSAPKHGVPAPPGRRCPSRVLRVSRDDVLVRMPGIGGTGVVTVSQILQMAAHARRPARRRPGPDRPGAEGRPGGLRRAHLARADRRAPAASSAARADVLLGFDVLGAAAPKNLAGRRRPTRTVAVVNTRAVPDRGDGHRHRRRASRRARATRRRDRAGHARRARTSTSTPQALAEALFGDHMPANMLLIGAAYQHGCLPVSRRRRSSRRSGSTAPRSRQNLAAFRWGRAAVVDPRGRRRARARRRRPSAAARAAPRDRRRPAPRASCAPARSRDLIALPGRRLRARYAEEVMHVAALAARARRPRTATAVAEAYAHGLHKLMAYKDEYEVARLHLDPSSGPGASGEFGADAKVSVLLHPPLLRALGMERKLKLGRWVVPCCSAGCARHAALRGTALDSFGHAGVRRVERALLGEYRELDARRARAPDARHRRGGRRDRRAARRGPRLRGHQARQRRRVA